MSRTRILAVCTVLSALILLMVPMVTASPMSSAFDLLASNDLSVIGKDAKESSMAVYIIRLEDAPLASYRGGVAGLRATSPAANGVNRLDVNSTNSVAYRDYLANQQAQLLVSMERALERSVEVVYHYDVAFNGMAVMLSGTEAAMVANLSGVAAVQKDTSRQLQSDVTPDFDFVEAAKRESMSDVTPFDATSNSRGTMGISGTKGEGIIVGVIDTGVWPEHPSFADDGSYSAPENWNGGCSEPEDGSEPYTCTNKLVGVQHFLSAYLTAVNEYNGFVSGRDNDGHGTHIASIAAGNENITATLLGVDRGTISGIAPRAHLASYKANRKK